MGAEMHEGLHVKCSIFLPDFNQNWSLTSVSVMISISNFIKIHSVVLRLLYAYRLMD